MEQTQVDNLLAQYMGRGRDTLLPALWEFQTAFGHINVEHVHAISHTLRVPEADIYGVVSFIRCFTTSQLVKPSFASAQTPRVAQPAPDDVVERLCARLGITTRNNPRRAFLR
jgi:NADH:ubiquinone oxidoreductase subunit E